MKTRMLRAALGGIEEELKILKVQLLNLEKNTNGKFSSLKGLLKKKSSFSFDEIKTAHFKLQKEY